MFIAKLKALKNLIFDESSFLYETGWIHSVSLKKPVDKHYNPIPWMNYSLIAFLDDRLLPSMNILEYGSGSSTLYFSKKVNKILSIEHDLEWYNKVSELIKDFDNVSVLHRDLGKNYYSAGESDKFDIIIVDGRDRVKCFEHSISRLNDKGVIILDNSDRIKYASCFEIAKKHNMRFISFNGPSPRYAKFERSTIFYREGNCFKI